MSPAALTFREVTDANRAEVTALRVAPGQDRFVNSVADAMEEAVEWARANPWYRSVYAGDEPIVPTGALDPEGEIILRLDLT